MRKFIHILLALSTNLFFVGCAHNFSKEGILEQRANYDTPAKEKSPSNSIARTSGTVKKAWLHAHEMPTGDYFGGAWVYLIVEKTKWNIKEND